MNKNNPNEIVLEIKNLFKKFENKIILNDLNIKISRGKSIGVMGPSGTGKSILLKCILGLTEYSGQILYNGKPLQGQIERFYTIIQECFFKVELFSIV